MADRSLRRAGTWARITAVALVAVTAVGCASEPPDPATVREQQVRDRLEATFSDQQASCILDALDATTIRALVRTTDLDPDDEAFGRYSDAVAFCARGAVGAGEAEPETTSSTTEAEG
jgi:hypothetical protein